MIEQIPKMETVLTNALFASKVDKKLNIDFSGLNAKDVDDIGEEIFQSKKLIDFFKYTKKFEKLFPNSRSEVCAV